MTTDLPPSPPAARWRVSRGSLNQVVSLLAWVHLYLVSMLGGWVVIVLLATGWQPVVLTSASMTPALRPGDVLMLDEHPAERVGQRSVVTFQLPGADHDQLVTHRVFEVLEDGHYVTKGDANPTPDTDRIHPDQVIGVGRLVIPLIGLPVVWASQGNYPPLAAFVIMTAVAVAVTVGTRVQGRVGSQVRGSRATTKLANRAVQLVRALAGIMVASQIFLDADRSPVTVAGLSLNTLLVGGLIGLGAVYWVSTRSDGETDPRRAATLVRLELAGDTLIVIVLTSVTGGTAVSWVLMALPIVEAAVRFRLAGALGHWLIMAAATFLGRLWILERADRPVNQIMVGLDQLLDQFGVLLLVAIPGAYLAEQLMVDVAAQQEATDSALARGRRLEHVAEISHEVNRLGAELYQTLTTAAVRLGFDGADVCVSHNGVWGVAASAGASPARTTPGPGLAGSGLRPGDLVHSEVVVDGADPDPDDAHAILTSGLGTLVRVTLSRTGDTHIALRASTTRAVLDAGSIEALRLLCGQATVALQNQELVTELQDVHVALEHQATHDALTGLPNRARFLRSLATQLASATDPSLRHVVLFLDLNGFKAVNDTHGHEAGDELLCQVAVRLQEAIGSSGLVARLGGDEFTVLLHPLDHIDQAYAQASRIHASLATPFELTTTRAMVGTSVGIAHSELGVDETELLRRADAAMYAAKTRGGATRTALYDPSMDEGDRRRGRLSAEFKGAFENNELSLAYQPVMAAQGGHLAGIEALLRWQHRDLGAVSTATILELAELAGLMDELNRWIVNTALGTVIDLGLGGGQSFFVAVNLSPTELESPELVTNIVDALTTHDIHPRQLVLELSERLVIDQPDQQNNIQALAGLGVTLALDDFGEGRTTLTHLRGIPITMLKLDRILIDRACSSEVDRTILHSIVGLAHDLALSVVAEGIEHSTHGREAVAAGADLLQGYGIYRPMPLAHLVQILDQTRLDPRPATTPPPTVHTDRRAPEALSTPGGE